MKRPAIPIGDIIRAALTEAGMTIEQAAEECSYGPKFMMRVCTNKTRPSAALLLRLGDVCPSLRKHKEFEKEFTRALRSSSFFARLVDDKLRSASAAKALADGYGPNLDALRALAAKQFRMPVASLNALLDLQDVLGDSEFRAKLDRAMQDCATLQISLHEAVQLL